MLLQVLHDSHVCNSLLVAESEEDIWKNESLYRQRLNTSDGESEEDAYRSAFICVCYLYAPQYTVVDVKGSL